MMNTKRKKEIKHEGLRRLDLCLNNISFQEMTDGGSLIQFEINLGFRGFMVERFSWMNGEFDSFVSVEEFESLDYDRIIEELYNRGEEIARKKFTGQKIPKKQKKPTLMIPVGMYNGKCVSKCPDISMVRWLHENIFVGGDRRTLREIIKHRDDCAVLGTKIATDANDIELYETHSRNLNTECVVNLFIPKMIGMDGICKTGVFDLYFEDRKDIIIKSKRVNTVPLVNGKVKHIRRKYITARVLPTIENGEHRFNILEILDINPKKMRILKKFTLMSKDEESRVKNNIKKIRQNK